MPFKSDKQRKWMFANEPEMAREWASKYNDGGAVMNKDHLANEFIKTIQRQGVAGGKRMLDQYRSQLTPQDMMWAEDVLMRASRVQGRQMLNQGGIALDPAKKGTFKAQATRAGMSGPAFANKVLNAPIGEFSPALRKKANFAKNFAYKNEGGMIGDMPMYNEGGMLMNHPYDREGEQFDTVPAMLTPGEFVIDADSTHRFQPLLEDINSWEPGMDTPREEMMTKEDEDIKIERKFKDGTKITVHSPEGSKAEISGLIDSLVETAEDEHDLLPVKRDNKNMGGYINMNEAGVVPNPNQQYWPALRQQIGDVTPQANPNAQVNAQRGLGLGFNLLSNASGQSVASNVGSSLIDAADATSARLSGDGWRPGANYEAIGEDGRKVFAREFTKAGQTKYVSGGVEYPNLAAIPPGNLRWDRAEGTSADEQSQKIWVEEMSKTVTDLGNAVSASNNLKQSSARAISLIEANKDKFGAGVLRGVVRQWLNAAETFSGVDLDFIAGEDVAVTNLNQILKSQLTQLVGQLRGEGVTFGAMTEAEWRLIGQQLGDLSDTIGGIYAIQYYLNGASELKGQFIREKLNRVKEARRKKEFNWYPDDFDQAYTEEGKREEMEQRLSELSAEAIDRGRNLNAGRNADEGEPEGDDVPEGASGRLPDGWNEDQLVNVQDIAESELPDWITEADRKVLQDNANSWTNEYDENNYVYRWKDNWVQSDTWQRGDASNIIGG